MAFEDEILSRQMPHSLEAEQSALGSMLIDADCIKDVMDKLQPDDFYVKQNRDIFETIYTMFSYSKPVDGVTVAEEMQKNGTYDDQTTRNYLIELMEITPTSANVMEYVKIIQNKSLLRSLAKAAGEITAMVQEGLGEAGDILEASEQRIYAIRRGRSSQELTPVAQLIKPFLDRLNELASGKTGLPGLPSGFSAVDQKIHGLNRSDLILLAARPGVGKSSFAMNMALNVARQTQKTVAVFSLEMSKESLMDRMLCAWGRVDMGRVRRAEFLDDTDWKKLADAADDLSRAKIFIDDTAGLTPLALRARCRRLKAEHGLDLVMVDYLQLMHSSRNESRELEISDISRNLKALAKEMKVPVLALSQLNRKVEERTDKRPVLSDLRESGAIEQDADLIMFIHREDQYNKKGDKPKTGIAEIILGKHRNGPTGTVELAYRSQYTAFDDLEASYTPPSEG